MVDGIERILQQAEDDGIQKLVVGAFIKRGDQFLIVKRSDADDFLPGIDEIPSGGVEAGECILTALRREVLEETGLPVLSVEAFVNAFDYVSGSGKHARQLNFSVRVLDDAAVTLNPAEHQSFVWCAADSPEFTALTLSEKTRRCVLEAAEFKKNAA